MTQCRLTGKSEIYLGGYDGWMNDESTVGHRSIQMDGWFHGWTD